MSPFVFGRANSNSDLSKRLNIPSSDAESPSLLALQASSVFGSNDIKVQFFRHQTVS